MNLYTVFQNLNKVKEYDLMNKVAIVNVLFGLEPKNKEHIEQQAKVLRSELYELLDAWKNRDNIEVIDGIGDALFVLLSLVCLDPDNDGVSLNQEVSTLLLYNPISITTDLQTLYEIVNEIIRSNTSKADITLEDAQNTSRFVNVHNNVDTTIQHVVCNNNDYYITRIINAPDDEMEFVNGKMMKSIRYYRSPLLKQFESNIEFHYD